MADNVAITAGSGTSIAADDVSSVFYQKIKVDAGGDGVSVPIVAGQQAMAASLPVVVASNQSAIPVSDGSGTLSVDDGAGSLTVDGSVSISGTVTVDSELPAAGALADGASNPTTPTVGAANLVFNGTTWDRARGDTSNGLDVDVTRLPALPAGTNNIGDVDVASIAAGETHIGEVGGGGTLLEVTLSLDTSAYADGDVMADTQSVSNAFRVSGGRAILQSVVVVDEDDVKQTFDIIFLDTNNSLGTENLAPSISDANARQILGRVRIDTGDYLDLGSVAIASKSGIGLMLKGNGSTSLFVGTIIRGAGTYTASGVRLRLGLLWD